MTKINWNALLILVLVALLASCSAPSIPTPVPAKSEAGAPVATAVPPAATSGAATKPTTAPAATPTPDVPSLPPELKDIPIPTGFAPKKDSIKRQEIGGKLVSATAILSGKGQPKDIVEFFQNNLTPKGWEDEEWNVYDTGGSIKLVSEAKKQVLEVEILKTTDGLEITMVLKPN